MKNITKKLLMFLIVAVIFGIVKNGRSQGTFNDIELSDPITVDKSNTTGNRYSPVGILVKNEPSQVTFSDIELSDPITVDNSNATGNRNSSMGILFDNGPVFNSAGTGAGGANESIYYQGGTGTYGSGCQYASGIYVADDFTVPSGYSWTFNTIDFYSYQTNSTTSSTITGVYVRIWDGKPGVAGSTVVWGDMATNRMGSTNFANVYRVLAANGGTARPIMNVVANTPGLSLNAGTYWVEYGCTGSLLSGPWMPPVVTSNNVTGNAIQSVDAGVTYVDILYNTYAQGFPFIIRGTESIGSFLFDNGPVVNSEGTGAGGANESIYYQGGIGTYGSGCQYASGIYVADDFTVPSGYSWTFSTIDFYSYQTNSTTSSTITGVYVRIWDGKPGVAGSSVVWGDMITNRMGSTNFANVYRVLTANGGAARPIMKVVANTPGLSLNAGAYWVEYGCTGSLLSGPWMPPVVTSNNVTGNAIQTVDAGVTYVDILYNTYAQGFPFIIHGTESGIVPLSNWALIIGAILIGTFAIVRYRRTV